jgi:hypothetical protein
MVQRKRAPGGGRKPGEFGKLGAVMGLRLPEKLRDKLKRAANQNGRTLSGEAISRLDASFGDRELRDAYWAIFKLDSWVTAMKHQLGLKSKGKR